MKEEELLERLREIWERVPWADYPETHEALETQAQAGFDKALQEPMWYAELLQECDEAGPMPELAASFVKDVYEEEISLCSGEAACNLGSLYYSGRIGEQDFSKAVDLYTQAAAWGDRQATENLGYCYYYGRNVPVDYEKAFHYFALGAFDGHVISLYKIGDMYLNGYYVERNEREAFYIYEHCLAIMPEEARDLCGADVCLRMADCYAEGTGTSVDFEQALRFYQSAANLYRARIMNGDFMIRQNYKRCVERENAIREILEKDFPEWSGF